MTSAYSNIFNFKTIYGSNKDIQIQFNPLDFETFQRILLGTNYRLVYFGSAYPLYDNVTNTQRFLTYDEYVREVTFLVDTTKTKNFLEIKLDMEVIEEELNN